LEGHERISAKLKEDFPNDEAMHVPHESLYQALFVQAKGQLKTGARKPAADREGPARASRVERRVIIEKKQAIFRMIMITERPREVADRAVPGH
jgi:IS30 family transposase